jgi:ribosomal-protein-alanine N-acetyltransferase
LQLPVKLSLSTCFSFIKLPIILVFKHCIRFNAQMGCIVQRLKRMLGEDCSLREAGETDLEAVMRIEKASFPRHPYPMDVFIILLKQYPRYFLVAECSSRVSGYVCGSLAGKNLGRIVSIAVEPELRRRGVGRMLMLELENRFRADRVKAIRLEVGVDNNAAIRLYESLGYETVGFRRGYYPDGSDALVMVKNLG